MQVGKALGAHVDESNLVNLQGYRHNPVPDITSLKAPPKLTHNLIHLTNVEVCWKHYFLKVSGIFEDGNHR